MTLSSLTIYSKSGSNSFLSGLFKKTYEYRSLTLMRDPTTGSLWLETGPPTGYLLLSPTSIGVVDEVTDWGSAINSSYLIAHPPFNSCSQDKGKQYHEKRLRLADLTEYWLADWKEWRRSYRSDSSTSTPPEEVSKKILNRFSDCAVMNADKETLEVVRPFLRKGLTREERGLDDWLDVKGFVR
ncbi:uncharacterized protein L199_006476 [Kwoniella botswanensis]|uniref:uncharacterized protein n=1 Tax=Kwoniella botswanensis TaxID=1268659 RepID=UPI00315D1006